MLMNVTEYHRPTDLAEAVALLCRADRPAAALAGGTELTGRIDDRLQALVDLSRLGLSGIRREGGRILIGAMTTLRELETAPLLIETAGGILARAAAVAAPATIRTAATLGGTLAGSKGGLELPTALLALGAAVTLADPEPRTVALADLLSSGVPPGSIITGVNFAMRADATGGLARVSRAPAERAIVFAAAVVAGESAVAAVGGVAPCPRLLDAAADPEAVIGTWEAVGDFRGSGEYRRWVGPVLVRRALAEAGWPGSGSGDAAGRQGGANR